VLYFILNDDALLDLCGRDASRLVKYTQCQRDVQNHVYVSHPEESQKVEILMDTGAEEEYPAEYPDPHVHTLGNQLAML